MSRLKPESVATFLERGKLGSLAAEARIRRETTEAVRQRLPADEGRELVAAHWASDGTLTLLMSSSAWAARVRYRTADLDAEKLEVRVAPRGSTSDR